MSKIVTFEQAERLERLGFDESISHYYELEDGEWGITNTLDKDFKDFFIRYPDERSIIRLAPTVHEALDYIREEKGIACGAGLNVNSDNRFLGNYIYEYAIDNNRVEGCSGFDTHSLAESALLDSLLDYLEKK